MSLEGKIEILNEIIAGNLSAQDIPLEFQGIPAAGLVQLRDELIMEARGEGSDGQNHREERERAHETAAHMAGHIRIKFEKAMAYHEDFMANGMFGRERLETFSSILENDHYWNFLMENEEERNRVREQHFNGMIQAIEDGERSMLEMSPREVDLQGPENMHRLRAYELEQLLDGVPYEKQEKIIRNFSEAAKAKMQRLEEKGHDELASSYENAVFMKRGENSAMNTSSQTEVAGGLEQSVEAESAQDIDFLFADIDAVAGRHTDLIASLQATGAREAVSETATLKVEEVGAELARQAEGGIQETGKDEPDTLLVQNASEEPTGPVL